MQILPRDMALALAAIIDEEEEAQTPRRWYTRQEIVDRLMQDHKIANEQVGAAFCKIVVCGQNFLQACIMCASACASLHVHPHCPTAHCASMPHLVQSGRPCICAL